MSDWYVSVNTHRCFIMSMMYILNLVGLHLKYYTDWHAVDENETTIANYGGCWDTWADSKHPGMMCRSVEFSPTTAFTDGIVASKYNKNSTPILRVEF